MNNLNDHITEGAIEAYVLGLCNEEEQKELDVLRKAHPEVNNAIIEFEIALEKKFTQNQVQLPADFKAVLKNKLSFSPEKTATPIVNMAARKWKYAAAIASVVTLSSITYNIIQQKRVNGLENRIVAFSQDKSKEVNSLFLNPGVTPVAMYGVGSHAICKCTLFWNKTEGKAYLMVHHLVQPSNGKNFQVWVKVKDAYLHAATINTNDYTKMIPLDKIPENANSFFVTMEDTGNTTKPTEDEIYLKGEII